MVAAESRYCHCPSRTVKALISNTNQMLWNWYTIDSCFIARSWRIRSSGAFAGSCIGVILLVIVLEFLRRTQREFDRYVRTANQRGQLERSNSDGEGSGSNSSQGKSGLRIGVRALGALQRGSPVGGSQLKLWQQIVRSLLYMTQFAVGYFVMLLAMYYNGMFSPFSYPLISRTPLRLRWKLQ